MTKNIILNVIPKMNFVPRQAINPYNQARIFAGKQEKKITEFCFQQKSMLSRKILSRLDKSPETDEFAPSQVVETTNAIKQKHKAHQKVKHSNDKLMMEKYFDNSSEDIQLQKEEQRQAVLKDIQSKKEEWYQAVSEELQKKEDLKNIEKNIETQKTIDHHRYSAELELRNYKDEYKKDCLDFIDGYIHSDGEYRNSRIIQII